MVTFDLALKPEGEGGVVDAGLPCHIHLLYVVLGEGLQHLRADIFLVGVHYLIIDSTGVNWWVLVKIGSLTII